MTAASIHSDERSATSPSTEIQLDLLRLLVGELREIGASDATLTEYRAVLATIPTTAESEAPTIAFLAHVDTSPGFNASDVKPIIHRNYDGSDIVLPDDPHQVLSTRQSFYLAPKTGEDIVTASGTTLLGADDKAGVAIIMAMARHLLSYPLVHELYLAAKIVMTLRHVRLTPETASGREDFIPLYQLNGNAATAELQFILRDFDEEKLAAHGNVLRQVCETVQATEPRSVIACEITPRYRNMRPVELAHEACRRCGIEPFLTPTRGGTDGSEMGVSTPNLFTGMQNIHGPLEWISVQDMSRATQVCIELAWLWSEQ